jgi:GT2 family glycosyltransferase
MPSYCNIRCRQPPLQDEADTGARPRAAPIVPHDVRLLGACRLLGCALTMWEFNLLRCALRAACAKINYAAPPPGGTYQLASLFEGSIVRCSPARICIVVVTFNDENHIPQLIASLERFALGRYPVVVVDNLSTDQTRRLLSQYEHRLTVRYLDRNTGFGAGNNVAFSCCDADAYFLLNSDAYLIGPTLEEVSQYLERNPNVGIVGVPLVYPDGSPQRFAYRHSGPLKWTLQALGIDKVIPSAIKQSTAESQTKPTRTRDLCATSDSSPCSGSLRDSQVDWVCGAAMVVTKQALIATGGFDENIFMYSEDEDLCLRVKQMGFDVRAIASTAVVHELGWGSNKTSKERVLMRLASNRYFVNKHFRHPLLRRYMLFLAPFRLGGLRAWLWSLNAT